MLVFKRASLEAVFWTNVSVSHSHEVPSASLQTSVTWPSAGGSLAGWSRAKWPCLGTWLDLAQPQQVCVLMLTARGPSADTACHGLEGARCPVYPILLSTAGPSSLDSRGP